MFSWLATTMATAAKTNDGLPLSVSPSSSLASLPTAAAEALTSPPLSIYSGPIVWHAVSATVAWGLLAPISLLFARGQQLKTARIPVHRATMVVTLILTLQAYLFAFIYTPQSSAIPPQHPTLTSALVLICVMQSVGAALRPAPSLTCPWRQAWRIAHRFVGISTVAFGLYILRHSVYVFRVDGWLRIFVFSFVGVGATAWGIVLIASLFAAFSDHPPSSTTPQDDYDKVVMEEGHGDKMSGSSHSDHDEHFESVIPFVSQDDVR